MGDERPPPSQRLNPLAIAKGQKLLCELTGKNASIVVNYFGVPYYYCDRTTLELDWNGIKHKIAQLLVPLRQPPSVIPSVEERERQESNVRKSKLALIDLCRMEATKFLVHGDFELSIPGAVQALRYSLDVYGAGKIQLVPCYLLLAEANLGLGRHKQAEEYLSLANWSILKNPDCSNRTKSQLYRNFGKLYASQGKHDEALRQLANDVYFSSLQVGPEHIETAGGYYYIATVFYLQRRIDCALAMCDKVVDIWLKHVSSLTDTSKADPAKGEVEPLGESQLMDGLQTLTKIVALREESMGPDHITTGEALYTVSLVYMYAKDHQRALQLMEKAYKIYFWELGPDNKRTQELAASIRLVGGVPQAPVGARPPRLHSPQLAEDQGGRGGSASPPLAEDESQLPEVSQEHDMSAQGPEKEANVSQEHVPASAEAPESSLEVSALEASADALDASAAEEEGEAGGGAEGAEELSEDAAHALLNDDDVQRREAAAVKLQARGKGMIDRKRVQEKKAAGELPGQGRQQGGEGEEGEMEGEAAEEGGAGGEEGAGAGAEGEGEGGVEAAEEGGAGGGEEGEPAAE